MRAISRFFPARARFFLFGLPDKESGAALTTGDSVVTLSDGIASAIGAHLTSSGSYVPALTLGAGPFIETRFLQKQRCFPKITRTSEPVVSLVSEGQLNYYRWLMETLPRLRFLRETGANYRQVYACQRKPFHRESLAVLLGPEVEIISSDRVPNLAAPQIQVPRFVEEDEPWILPWLRDQAALLPKVTAAIPEPRRLYISRRGAQGRQVANEAELAKLLEEFGFTTILLEDLAWPEQVRLFQEAEVVLAPHGAGLANIAFCRGAKVIELIADAYPFTFYPEICRQLSLDHHRVSSEPVQPDRIHASDLIAPLPALRKILTSGLS